MKFRLFAPLFGLIAASGCASTAPDAAYDDVAKTITDRTGRRTHWLRGTTADADVERAVKKLLESDLGPDEAVQIALLNNRKIQGAYEELGVAQAELVEAGLLENPVFSGALRFPTSGGAPTLELGVAQSFIELLFLSDRKNIAGLALERSKLRVAAEILDLSAEVRRSYFELVAAEQIIALERVIVETTYTSAELARRQNEAGNMSDLELASHRALYEETRLDLARDELAAMEQREALTRLMGLFGDATAFRVRTGLPDLPANDPSLDALESKAIASRLDLQAMKRSSEILEAMLELAHAGRYIGATELGAVAEREPDGSWSVGPEVSLELPIFNQGQATLARLEAELAQSRAHTYAMAVDIRSEVRSAREQMRGARRIAEHYRTVLIPLRERVVRLTQEQYDAMLTGVYELLAAKREEIGTYREYLHAMTDYFVARAELEQALGGRLPDAMSGPTSAPSAPSAPPPQPVDHSGHVH